MLRRPSSGDRAGGLGSAAVVIHKRAQNRAMRIASDGSDALRPGQWGRGGGFPPPSAGAADAATAQRRLLHL
jgi:hypothetical protein